VTQAGFKWLKAAGFPLADDIRVSYNPNLRYVTVTYDVPLALAAKLPIPESHANTLGVYMYLPHDDVQSCFISLLKTDNDKSRFPSIFGNFHLTPRSASYVLDYE
jgi:hypothetical protein